MTITTPARITHNFGIVPIEELNAPKTKAIKLAFRSINKIRILYSHLLGQSNNNPLFLLRHSYMPKAKRNCRYETLPS